MPNISKCKWTKGNYTCSRNIYGDGDFCLFHKPNKNNEEIELFWRVINWKRPQISHEDILRCFHGQNNIQEQILLSNKIKLSQESNFSDKDKNRSDFEDYKKFIIDLEENSKIWINPNVGGRIDCIGFIFPNTIDYKFDFQIPFGFNNVLYEFDFCKFESCANFYGYVFRGNTHFFEVDFNAGVLFQEAQFYGNVDFIDCKIGYGAGFIGYYQFFNTKFLGKYVNFSCKNHSGLDLYGSNFGNNTDINLNMNFPKSFGTASYTEVNYRIAKNQTLKVGDYLKAGDYYYLERIYKRVQIIEDFSFRIKSDDGKTWIIKENLFNNIRILKEYRHKLWENFIDWLVYVLTGYGERPFRIILSSLFVILIGGMFFNIYGKTNGPLDSLFYSIITFTTLGAKIPDPLTWQIKLLLGIESFIGGLFMALFVLTISKRYSRG